jgi:hypothetical protein
VRSLVREIERDPGGAARRPLKAVLVRCYTPE